MLNKRVGSLALVLITTVAAGLYGCGSDDDTVASGGSGGGGAGGGAGKGGGGSGAKAGSAGTAGGSEAGAAGSSAGAMGEEGGMGGAAPGAGAGAGGAAGGEDAGAGGEAGGGSVPLTLTQACTITCSDQTALSCTFGSSCMDTCTGNEGMTRYPAEYDAMVACEAQHLTPSNYECSNQGGTNIWPAPKAATTCETAICTWTCDDATICDVNIYERCNCP